jgi:hypothetical protein
MNQNGAPQTIGIIFALFPHHIRRFLDENKSVFVKFYGRKGMPSRIHPGSKLFFYESKGNKEIVGEATISAMSTETANDVVSKFGDALFLTSKELDEYAKNRQDRKMLVLILKSSKRYNRPMRIGKPITKAGRYMTDELRRTLTTVDE